ncbi:50S ribosomal protein L24 [Desulfovibrio sp. OttesenSCG-928-M14]|nr:50S ribosomal protein L24 [Desulfovibrio sp. OttesenSCG-928-M14]MDL2290934.1 50S ribosomal protein L24 [Desulfovibrio sp. OttesenSCG-928-F20]
MKQFRIHKDDVVMVTAGKDKGKIGRVLKILRKKDRVLVEKVNMAVRHTKPNPQLQQPGGRLEKEMPLHISNVILQCPACKKSTRVGYRYIEEVKDGKSLRRRVRFCKKCNEIMAQGGKKK